MRKIVLFDTSIATLNIGDEIIMSSIRKVLKDFLINSYCINFPSHTPPFTLLQRIYRRKTMLFYDNIDYKFVCGTNLLYTSMFRPLPNWNINIFNFRIAKNSILLGVGMGKNSNSIDLYTKYLYKKVLSKTFVHSVRDEKTRKMLNDLGFKALNTGCPTLWLLTDSHCKKIPHNKSQSVVFTLTHYAYAKDMILDKEMIAILRRNYDTIYFWPQCVDDLAYLNELNESEGIIVLPSNLESYERILQTADIDYVGNRLHGGIYALQNKKRTIIISVDYRAEEMHKTFNIPCISRCQMAECLESKIQSSFETQITGVDFEKINNWLGQFI